MKDPLEYKLTTINLSWEAQMKNVNKVVSCKIHLLTKIRQYRPTDTRKLFYKFYPA